MASPSKPQRSIHPGSGRRRGRDFPRGRQVEPDALAEVQALLGGQERRRDLLIEFLHLIQDKFGCLHARHLTALAAEMKLALVEVYEVASFYAHFDIVMEGEPAPPPLDRARVRQPDLRPHGRRAAPGRAAAEARRGRARRARAVHGRLPQRAGRGAGPCAARARDERQHRRRGRHGRHASARPVLSRARRLSTRRRLSPARRLPRRAPHGRSAAEAARRCGAARPRRRRVPDRAQVGPGARRAGAAPDGGQRRRRRAGHVQGPLFPRNRSAPLSRRHALGRLGGRGA